MSPQHKDGVSSIVNILKKARRMPISYTAKHVYTTQIQSGQFSQELELCLLPHTAIRHNSPNPT